MFSVWNFLCLVGWWWWWFCIIVPANALFVRTSTPPLLSSPVFSLATITNRNDDGDTTTTTTTNHNILTYATPVSVLPDRMWCLGLYKQTLSYENFVRNRCGILQLLTNEHIPYVRLLGGKSGRDISKIEECQRLGCPFEALHDDDTDTVYQLISKCQSYIKLIAVGDIVDAGSHAIAICRVDATYTNGGDENASSGHLATATLRDLGIINEQGRVVDET